MPEPVEEEYVPEPTEGEYVPEPVEEEYVPEPVEKEYVAEPVEEEYTPEPTEEEYVAEPVEEEYTPEPTEEEYVPELTEEENVSEPTEEEYVPEPVEEEFVSAQPDEATAAATTGEEPATVPEGEEPAAVPEGEEAETAGQEPASDAEDSVNIQNSDPKGVIDHHAETPTADNEEKSLAAACGEEAAVTDGEEKAASLAVATAAEGVMPPEILLKAKEANETREPEEDSADGENSLKNGNDDLKTEGNETILPRTGLTETDSSLPEEAVQVLSERNVAAEGIGLDGNGAAVSLGASGLPGNAMATLEEMFNEAMKNRAADARKVRLNLAIDTIYEGDATFSNDGYDVDDDFEVELAADDAGEDYLQSEGTTAVAGNITIKGINVRMLGIAMAAGKIVTVEDAKLEYYGTKQEDNLVVNVKGDKGKADIYTGAGDDNLQLSVEADSLNVDTGDGNDKVEVGFTGNTANINTGADNDTVSLTAVSGTVTVDTGVVESTADQMLQNIDGDDTVTATVADSSVTIRTGAGDDFVNTEINSVHYGYAGIETGDGEDSVKFAMASSAASSSIETGGGSDTVEAVLNSIGYGITVDTGTEDDSVTLTFNETVPIPILPWQTGQAAVNLGDGNDSVKVDLLYFSDSQSVQLDGGEGEDTLHLSGLLNPRIAEDERATGTETDLNLVGLLGDSVHITTNGFTAFSDDLENKRTVEITPEDGVVDYTADGSFTNFVVKGAADALKNVKIRPAEGSTLTFSQVLIDTPTEGDGENKLVVTEDATIDARGMKLVMNGENIEIKGKLMADSVILQSTNGGGRDETGEEIIFTILDEAIPADLLHLIENARIVISDTAAVLSSGDVIMLAQVEHGGETGNVALKNLSVVNVNVSRASIDIAGKICAGYDFDKESVNADKGSIIANAQVKTTMGMDENGKPVGTGLSLGVSVADVDASINIQESAELEAADDVTLSSRTEMNVASRADSGTAGAPFSAAINVLISDSHNMVNGKVTSQKGSVKITADGKMDGAALADKGRDDTSNSGVYTAVTVALQDVKAAAGSHGIVTAIQGDAQLQSNAAENISNQAISATKTASISDDSE
ncbi:MAG: hypothetical protein IKE58_09125 [Blautia sp.]|nr:hypothetical protein [Blautia sp.]